MSRARDAHIRPVGGKSYTLTGPTGKPYPSLTPGRYGGHRATKVYGRLDCPAALRALARGHYSRSRVFFADESAAVAAGYRPCAVCLPERYRTWKSTRRIKRPLGTSNGRPAKRARRDESDSPRSSQPGDPFRA